MATAIATYFSNPENTMLVDELLDLGVEIENPQPAGVVQAGFWSGKTVVFTGALVLDEPPGGRPGSHGKGGQGHGKCQRKNRCRRCGCGPRLQTGQSSQAGGKSNDEDEFLRTVKKAVSSEE